MSVAQFGKRLICGFFVLKSLIEELCGIRQSSSRPCPGHRSAPFEMFDSLKDAARPASSASVPLYSSMIHRSYAISGS
jgi:hypothetical protein